MSEQEALTAIRLRLGMLDEPLFNGFPRALD